MLSRPLIALAVSLTRGVLALSNECGGEGDYMNFIMPTVASVDTSRPVWPSCPAPGWVSGVDRLSARPNGEKLITGAGGAGQSRSAARSGL